MIGRSVECIRFTWQKIYAYFSVSIALICYSFRLVCHRALCALTAFGACSVNREDNGCLMTKQIQILNFISDWYLDNLHAVPGTPKHIIINTHAHHVFCKCLSRAVCVFCDQSDVTSCLAYLQNYRWELFVNKNFQIKIEIAEHNLPRLAKKLQFKQPTKENKC